MTSIFAIALKTVIPKPRKDSIFLLSMQRIQTYMYVQMEKSSTSRFYVCGPRHKSHPINSEFCCFAPSLNYLFLRAEQCIYLFDPLIRRKTRVQKWLKVAAWFTFLTDTSPGMACFLSIYRSRISSFPSTLCAMCARFSKSKKL